MALPSGDGWDVGVRASWASSGRRDSNTRLRGLAFPLKAIGFQTFYA